SYQEHVKIDKKALVVYGTGLGPRDVLIHEKTISALPAVLTISNHPTGQATRIANLSIGKRTFLLPGGPVGVDIQQGSGEIVLDHVIAIRRFRVLGFKGNVLLAHCEGRGAFFDKIPRRLDGAPGLEVQGVPAMILNSCTFTGDQGEPSFGGNEGKGGPGVHATGTTLEIVHPRILGGKGVVGGIGNTGSDGGPGLVLIDSKARVSGIAADFVRGGDAPAPRFAHPKGGAGAELTRSTLEHSGVVLAGGGGPVRGPVLRKDASSTVITPSPALASIRFTQPFRLGKTAVFQVHGPGGQLALGYLAYGLTRLPLPFGPLYLDPARLLFPVAAVLDRNGQATFRVPLERDPGLIGLVLIEQVLTIDKSLALTLAAPAASVVLR
ncbi:MAG: hypothetical protein ACE5F1_22460, partial [Planctomycetota bacterium]